MSDQSHMSPDDARFVDRIAAILRRSERLDDSFEDRLVTALQADAANDRETLADGRPRILRQAWWRTPITLQLSPMAALAIAASCAAIISLSTLGLTRLGGTGSPLRVVQSPP